MQQLYKLFRRALFTALALWLVPGAGWAQNVGIGTTTPTQALDVNGQLRVRGLTGSGTRLPSVLPDGTLGASAPYTAQATTPTFPTAATGSVGTGNSPLSVAVGGTKAYVVNRQSNSLQVFDVSAPATPALLSTSTTANAPFDVAVSGTLAYVVTTSTRFLQVFDVSTPTAPVLRSTTAISASAGGNPSVAASGTTVYVGASSSLLVFDASAPAAPKLQSTVNLNGSVSSLAVSGTTVYVAGSTTLQVVDVSAPAAPVLQGTINTGASSFDVAVSGTTAYVGSIASESLQVFDVSVPTAPVLKSTTSTGSCEGVAVSGTTTYVVNGNNLQVFDVSTPTVPVLLGTVDASGARAVAVSGTTAYVVINNIPSLLQVFSVSLPPRVVAVNPDGTLSSVSPATLADNLGNHTATQNLNLNGNSLLNAAAVQTAAVQTPTTGSHNMLAVAYGSLGGPATEIASSSANFTYSHPSAGRYVIAFTPASSLNGINFANKPVSVSPYSDGVPVLATYIGGTGTITIYTYSLSGTLTDSYFSFAAFAP